jgi:hypothetical protein
VGSRLLALSLLAAAAFSAPIQDLDGAARDPLHPSGKASVLFFITTDCPISNFYAPEVRRICSDYSAKGVSCTLVYVDSYLTAAEVRKHRGEFSYDKLPVIHDVQHHLIKAAGATITPQAIVAGPGGKILYSGRIDNFYAALGQPRREATEHDLRVALTEIVAGKPVSHPKTQPVGCYIPPPDISK